MNPSPISRFWRHAILGVAVAGSLVWLLCRPPIRQDPHYHEFADRRAILGIPNFMDVISNAPFLAVGLTGLRLGLRGRIAGASSAWTAFFGGVGLVTLGSAYYHWQPTNESLLWDRLPMTLGFMGLFAALLEESVAPNLGRAILKPALLVGLSSVLYWRASGDLRFYAWVQGMPLLVIPIVLVLFESRHTRRWFLIPALACYALAKGFEARDAAVFELTHGKLGGHAVKHVLAATGCWILLRMVQTRTTKPGSVVSVPKS